MRPEKIKGSLLASLLGHHSKWRPLALTLSVIVVFVTTYILILPAVTLDEQAARTQGGIDLAADPVAEEQAEPSDKGGAEAGEVSAESPVDAGTDADAPAAKTAGPDEPQAAEENSGSSGKDAAVKSEEAEDAAKTLSGTLSFSGDGYDITATCSEKAGLPLDTELTAEEIAPKSDDYESYYQKALSAVQKKDGKSRTSDFEFAKFYDISLMADGENIEPASGIDVEISYDKALPVSDADQIRIVHFAVDEKTGKVAAEVLDDELVTPSVKKNKMTAAEFEADSFSVYAVTALAQRQDGTDANDPEREKKLTTKGKDYTIEVTCGENAGIPEGATLEAKEIPAGTKTYKKMLAQSKEVLDEDGKSEITFSRFFDVSIHNADGKEIEPENPVTVSIQYDEPLAAGDGETSIVHFAEDGIEVIEAEGRLEGSGEEGEINVFEYEQGSFSGVGTIIETDSLEDGQYFIVVGEGGSYYAMKNDGSLAPVTYYSQTKQVEATPGINENDLLWNVSSVGYGYYTFKAVNGDNYLSLQNGAVVNNQSANVRVQHNAWDESQNETGGYYLYHTPNPWVSSTWNPLRLGYWDNAGHFYVGGSGEEAQRIKLYKYAMSASSGEPPATDTYTGIEVNPSELDEWLMSLFDDMPIGYDGYHKSAEVYDYENRIYQVDLTALSNAQGFASDIDIAFSVDMSNSMLFPSTLTEIGTIELRQSVLENTLDKDEVYFVISDIKQTATVTAVFYENGVWKHEDASKYARGQRNQNNTDVVVPDYSGYKIGGNDTGFYTLYKADPGYVAYIKNNGSVWENPYNRLADMKQSLKIAFNFLDIMKDKYNATIRVGWNGFARDVQYDNGKTGQSQEKFDYRCVENGHALQNLENVNYNDIISGFADAGNQTGGGTRPDKAFDDAFNMGWGSNTQKYLVLITDGAPQGGGASSPAAALTLGQEHGQNLTNSKGVNIVSIGLSTEHVDGAASLFEAISCQDPNPDSNQQMIYQAKDGDALKSAVTDALRILVSKAITVGTIKDTIDPAFYPVSTDGTPLKAGDKIDLNGKKTTDTSKPYGVIGWDGQNWTVEWTDQDIVWPDEEHPYGWHGKVLVKAKENFLGGNNISTNEGEATLDVKNAKVQNADGSWSNMPFNQLMELDPDQLETRYMDTPHVNVDELEMTKNDTEWTVYLNTEVDPGEQMKALFNEIKVMKVVTDGGHEMVVPSGKTARDTMVYDLVPTEDGHYNYEEASSDARDKRNVDQAFFYLKDLFSMEDSLGNKFITDNMTADQAIAKLLAGEKVEVNYQGYGHDNVGKIILELKADPGAQVNNLDEHNASPVGNGIEKYILSAEYKPTPESGSGAWYWNTGSFGTKDRGKAAEDKTKTNTHIINVIKRILTIRKTDSAGTLINDANAGEATFEIYQKDSSGNKINASTVTAQDGVYTWNPVTPDEDQKIPNEYWADSTTYYIKEVNPPKGYAAFDGEVTVTLDISDTATDIPNNGDHDKVPFNWEQSAVLAATGDSGYVTVTGNSDITVAVKNDRSVDIVVIKTDTDGEMIPGAKFSLAKNSQAVDDLKVIRKGGSWDVPADRITVNSGEFEIPAGGVTILGLGAGEYTLTETQAPAGYLKTVQPITFTAGRDGTVTYTNAADNPAPRVTSADSNRQYTIQNEAGAELPQSGGPGTTAFYLLGILLSLISGILLIARRRTAKTF